MSKFSRSVLLGAVMGAALAAQPAQALTFQLIDYNGSVAGTVAERGFKMAAAYWSSVLTSDAVVRLEIGYIPLATNVIGSTGSTRYGVTASSVYQQLAATGNSALDATAVANLTPLTAAGGLQMITSGYRNDATKVGIDVSKQVFDNDNSANNLTMGVNGAALKALGYTGFNPNQRDAQVNFSTNFAFDFDPTDGITPGKMDFIGVAIHEIGHALGFTSGVDIYDNPANANANANGSSNIWTTLDLFRYSNDPNNVAPGAGPALDLSVGANAYFSIDGGQNQLFGGSLFSTGRNQGDGQQASHWKDLGGCTGQEGIMDPNFCYAQMGEITALDIAAFDALGWNVSFDVLANSGYKITSADIYRRFAASVPEPATWAMLIAGFGMVGAAVRRRRTTIAFA
ncbi:MAG: hypothetical protein DI623_14055 [Sphingomonas sanxanigenens]|uniref:Ice-binding protein C-terminal domain-containing protein n=1 Tax=Sphingomonas sanxanigenens TaxID=397260 RepID=A0A2W5C1C6_9SPHN|nr:MAG: hypothetical protein DI623_14055 [Sphingomonas sanxanigenens]